MRCIISRSRSRYYYYLLKSADQHEGRKCPNEVPTTFTCIGELVSISEQIDQPGESSVDPEHRCDERPV